MKPQEPRAYGATELDYNNYLFIPQLLQLQKPQSEPAHHDEMLFIIIHQAYELWFKLILHELEQALEHVKRDEVLKAQHFVKRVVEIFRILVPQIHILETMRPVDFLAFRDRLNPRQRISVGAVPRTRVLRGSKRRTLFGVFQKSPRAC